MNANRRPKQSISQRPAAAPANLVGQARQHFAKDATGVIAYGKDDLQTGAAEAFEALGEVGVAGASCFASSVSAAVEAEASISVSVDASASVSGEAG